MPSRSPTGCGRRPARPGRYHWVQKWGAATGEGEAVMTRLPVDADGRLPADRAALGRDGAGERERPDRQRVLDPPRSSVERDARRAGAPARDLDAPPIAEQRIVAGDFNGWPGTAEINEMAADAQRRLGGRARRRHVACRSPATRTATRATRGSTTCWSSKQATALRSRARRSTICATPRAAAVGPQPADRDVRGAVASRLGFDAEPLGCEDRSASRMGGPARIRATLTSDRANDGSLPSLVPRLLC